MNITILGCGSSTPSEWRKPSSQFIEIGQLCVLLDCGEGTIFQLLANKILHQKIDLVLISHLHGDHYAGLFGLITAMNSSGRIKPLTVFGPNGLSEIITLQLYYSKTKLNFEIDFRLASQKVKKCIFENQNVSIFSFPLNHRVTCSGFLLEEIVDGQTKSYAYCSDTLADDSYADYIQNVDLLYHEATFESKMINWAIKTKHSTALQAAETAKMVGARRLLLGHFSSRYNNVDHLILEAKAIFENVQEAIEGKTYVI